MPTLNGWNMQAIGMFKDKPQFKLAGFSTEGTVNIILGIH